MEILSLVNINWPVIIIIVLSTHLFKSVFPAIKPYCVLIVLVMGFAYSLALSLYTGSAILDAVQNGFLHSAVSGYSYNLIFKPAKSVVEKTNVRLKGLVDKIKNGRQ